VYDFMVDMWRSRVHLRGSMRAMMWQQLRNIVFRHKNLTNLIYAQAIPFALILEMELIFTHLAQVHTSCTNVGSYITNLIFIQPKFPNTGEPQVHISSHHSKHHFTNTSVPKHC